MDRRERQSDPVEEQRAAQEGKQAEIHTAMPGIIASFDPVAMTATVQPAIRAKVEGTDGILAPANLPVLVDVPVVFPGGGGFTLTFPVKEGDECLIVFGERCIDAWWAYGGVQDALESRMHDLSDAFAYVGVRSQPRKLVPAVDPENVQLRTDDQKANVTIKPDYTVRSENPECSITQSPSGEIAAVNKAASVTLTPGGEVNAEGKSKVTIKAPIVDIQAGSFKMSGYNGGRAVATMDADIDQTGWHKSTGDQTAGGVSQINHPHRDGGGTGPSGPPIAGA